MSFIFSCPGSSDRGCGSLGGGLSRGDSEGYATGLSVLGSVLLAGPASLFASSQGSLSRRKADIITLRERALKGKQSRVVGSGTEAVEVGGVLMDHSVVYIKARL